MVKYLPTIQETWIRSLGREDPLEKGKSTHSSILAWTIPWQKMSLLEITKGPQFQISNHEEPHASPHWTRKGNAFIEKTWKLGGL